MWSILLSYDQDSLDLEILIPRNQFGGLYPGDWGSFIFLDSLSVRCWRHFEVGHFDQLICILGIGDIICRNIPDIPTKSNLGIFRILTIPLDQVPESAENFAYRISVVNWRIIATRTELTNYSLSQKFRI